MLLFFGVSNVGNDVSEVLTLPVENRPKDSSRESVTVIVVTFERPDCVERCLKCLHEQSRSAEQIIVVDASHTDTTREIVSRYPGVLYLRNENGRGRMTQSRNIGLRSATGSVIAFIDDDAFAHHDWLANLIPPYRDPAVGAVGGRALNQQPGEESVGVDRIGQITSDGEIAGNFAADPGKILLVDHIIGCNMSFRRHVLAELGGFREDYPGISGLCEDTDVSLRVRKIGYKILFIPTAKCDHIGAPQPVGRRFDVRWEYYNKRNTACMLVRNYGLLSSKTVRFYIKNVVTAPVICAKRVAGAIVRMAAIQTGLVTGVAAGIYLTVKTGSSHQRSDEGGLSVTQALSKEPPGTVNSTTVK